MNIISVVGGDYVVKECCCYYYRISSCNQGLKKQFWGGHALTAPFRQIDIK